MTALVTADLHFSINPRDNYRFKIGKTLRSIAVKHKVTLIVILGDLTESKDNHSSELVNQICDIFSDLAADYEVIILKGNHDYLVPDHPFFKFLGHINNIHWINEPEVIECDELGSALFLPHTHTFNKDWAGMQFLQRWVFCHQTFDGAKLGNGQFASAEKYRFPKGIRVISGDVHVPQTVGCVEYVGAPYTVDFGDKYKPRVLLLDGEILDSIAVPGPQKRLIELNSIDELSKYKSGSWSDLNPGDLIKIRVCLSNEEYPHWNEYRDKVNQWGKQNNYQIYQVQPVITNTPVSHSTIMTQRGTKSDQQILKDYGQQRSVDLATLKTGLKLIEEQ